jgi:triacylglycerol lipase
MSNLLKFSKLLQHTARATAVAAALGVSAVIPVRAAWFDGLFPAATDSTYTRTQYPIVLVHGMLGFDAIAGVDYFYGIPQKLKDGGATVFVASVSGLNSSEARGEQLLAQIKTVLATTGAAKVNLIGHSHGGPTIRYVAGVAPQLVASVTSVAGANKGSKVADVVGRTFPSGTVGEAVVVAITGSLANFMGLLSGRRAPEVPLAALNSLSTSGAAVFNAKFPQALPSGCDDGAEVVNGVRYYSWTGNAPFTNLLDPLDYPLAAASVVHHEANDGLISVCSSKLGKSLGVYSHNHADEINQMLGLRGLFSPDPITLYRDHANRLKGMGL